MNNFLYYIIIIPISNLNNFFLFLVSDVLYLIVGRLLKYRKPLITKNLKNSFPKKSENEIKSIFKKKVQMTLFSCREFKGVYYFRKGN